MKRTATCLAIIATLAALAGCGSDDDSAKPKTPESTTTTTTTPTTTAAATSTGSAAGHGPVTLSDPPTAAEISKTLQQRGNLGATEADCSANIYLEEGISKDGLEKTLSVDYTKQVDPATIGLTVDDIAKVGKATGRIVTECFG